MGWQGIDIQIDAKSSSTTKTQSIYRFEADFDDTDWRAQQFDLENERSKLIHEGMDIIIISFERNYTDMGDFILELKDENPIISEDEIFYTEVSLSHIKKLVFSVESKLLYGYRNDFFDELGRYIEQTKFLCNCCKQNILGNFNK